MPDAVTLPAAAFNRLRIAGDLLSNCAFNLAQNKGLPLSLRACQSLDECRKDWDAAREAVALAAHPEPAPAPTDALRDVIAERQRQKDVELWTPEHDDEHVRGELEQAAACLLVDGTDAVVMLDGEKLDVWRLASKHHGNWRRELVIAGALVLAAIEQWDRAHASQPGERA